MGLTPTDLVARVLELVPGASRAPAELVRGQAVVVVPREHIAAALLTLRDHADLQFMQLMDLSCVDYLGRTPRFEVVYQLLSFPLRHRLRVKVALAEDDAVIPSAVPVWKSADWAEREVFDMFGVRFSGHPNLRRILMYESFEGHPLRKDYQLDRRQPLVPERDPIDRPWYSNVKDS
jgi:NADH-quinone oxidoreductase subunit C